jgi:GT2 family glycosyltransferase/O-antigen ligase
LLWLWLVGRLVPGCRIDGAFQPVRLLGLLVMWTVVASWVASAARPISPVEERQAALGLAVMAATVGVMLFAADTLTSRSAVRRVLQVVVVCCAINGLLALLQFTLAFDPFQYLSLPGLPVQGDSATYIGERSILRRVGGTTSHPIELAVLEACVLPIALYFVGVRGLSRRARVFWWTCVLLIAAAILAAVSRSGLLVVAIVIALLLPAWTWRQRAVAASILVAGGAFVKLLVPGLGGTLIALFRDALFDPSILHRTNDYSALLPYVTGSPAFGRGFRTFIPSTYDFLLAGYPYVDNQYLMSLIETGAIGLLALVALVGGGVLVAGLSARHAPPDDRRLAHALAVAIVGAAVGFVTFDALGFQEIRMCTFLLIGCAGALWRLREPTLEEQPIRAGSRPHGITVAVVLHNSAEHLADFTVALKRSLSGVGDHHIVFCDNQSSDGSPQLAATLVHEATLIRLGRNAGYAAGINAVASSHRPSRALLVVNPDVRIMPAAIDELWAALDQPGIGIAVPRLLDRDGQLVRSLRRDPTVLRALGEALIGGRAGQLRVLGEVIQDRASYDRAGAVDWASGAMMLISRECLDAVGNFDERYFLYSEEADFALRARAHGFNVAYVPSASARHLKPESAPSARLWTILTVNRIRLYRHYHGWLATAAFAMAVVLGESIRAAVGRSQSRAALRALLAPSKWSWA